MMQKMQNSNQCPPEGLPSHNLLLGGLIPYNFSRGFTVLLLEAFGKVGEIRETDRITDFGDIVSVRILQHLRSGRNPHRTDIVVRRRIQQFADLTHQGRLAHIHLFGQEFVREFGIPEILADDGAELLQELLILSGESEHVDGHSRDSLLQRIAQECPAVEDVLDTRNEVLQVERLLDIEVRSGLQP